MKTKWRPPLGLVISGILLLVLALPLSGLVFFRLYENQFVRQTEAELIVQSAAIAAFYAEALERELLPDLLDGPVIKGDPEALYQPIDPALDLATEDILPSRPDARPAAQLPDKVYSKVGNWIDPILPAVQQTSLAGFRVLDHKGTVIAGRSERGLSLAHVPEVAKALTGTHASAIRVRVTDEPPPPLYSISRGTRIRVFVALPVLVNDRVAGVVYASRTPSHILRHLYGERGKVALWAVFVLMGTALIGYVFMRTITVPVNRLLARSEKLANGDRSALEPLPVNGTREMEALADGFLTMARQLQDRSDYVRSYANHVSHELKSPLTSIIGAAEILEDDTGTLTKDERRKFAGNIGKDARRLDALVTRLRDHARAETTQRKNQKVTLDELKTTLRVPSGVKLETTGGHIKLPLSAESATMIFGNLIDNAAAHGAKRVSIAISTANETKTIAVADDGSGISAGNRDRVFEPFFTTNRENGGTGMGLAIVATVLRSHQGTIDLLPSDAGAKFKITLPKGHDQEMI